MKEDQAQNTCIFSTEFSLRVMGDVQQYFIDHKVRNFYSVSISGYHIAEAGANPITQLALTLSNGFTFVEYYVSRGMHIDQFAPNLSFFFSNGVDPEYAVIGRTRRIWAKAMKLKYGANELLSNAPSTTSKHLVGHYTHRRSTSTISVRHYRRFMPSMTTVTHCIPMLMMRQSLRLLRSRGETCHGHSVDYQ